MEGALTHRALPPPAPRHVVLAGLGVLLLAARLVFLTQKVLHIVEAPVKHSTLMPQHAGAILTGAAASVCRCTVA